MRVVSNAGPIIHLSWIGRLDLLHALFDEVVVPSAVRDEILRAGPVVPGVAAIRDAFAFGWLTVQSVRDRSAMAAIVAGLDLGESEAIVLMRELAADVLLLDERRARAYAQREHLPITGTLGILRLARERAFIPAVMPLLEELRRKGFRISTELIAQMQLEESARGLG